MSSLWYILISFTLSENSCIKHICCIVDSATDKAFYFSFFLDARAKKDVEKTCLVFMYAEKGEITTRAETWTRKNTYFLLIETDMSVCYFHILFCQFWILKSLFSMNKMSFVDVCWW